MPRNSNIMAYNGGAIVAMTGKDCVGIASDRRLGAQLCTVAMDFQKVFELQPKLYVGLAGLATDVMTLHQLLDFRLNLYRLREERDMSPAVLTHLISTLLYEKRFQPYFCEPIVAGLEPNTNQPYLSTMDLLGCKQKCSDYVVTGTCTANLYGMCESMYKPDMDPDTLFETLAQTLLSAVDRDCLSGWGGVVHIITRDGVTTKELKGRQD